MTPVASEERPVQTWGGQISQRLAMIFFKVVPIRRDHVSNVHLMDHQDTTPTPSSTNSLLSTYGTALIIDRVLRMRSSHRWTPKTVQAHKVTAYSELHTERPLWFRDSLDAR